jgi:hypothetical protein
MRGNGERPSLGVGHTFCTCPTRAARSLTTDPELASYLRIEERELEASGRSNRRLATDPTTFRGRRDGPRLLDRAPLCVRATSRITLVGANRLSLSHLLDTPSQITATRSLRSPSM